MTIGPRGVLESPFKFPATNVPLAGIPEVFRISNLPLAAKLGRLTDFGLPNVCPRATGPDQTEIRTDDAAASIERANTAEASRTPSIE